MSDISSSSIVAYLFKTCFFTGGDFFLAAELFADILPAIFYPFLAGDLKSFLLDPFTGLGSPVGFLLSFTSLPWEDGSMLSYSTAFWVYLFSWFSTASNLFIPIKEAVSPVIALSLGWISLFNVSVSLN